MEIETRPTAQEWIYSICIFNLNKTKLALIGTFEVFKSPGLDEIFPALLQAAKRNAKMINLSNF